MTSSIDRKKVLFLCRYGISSTGIRRTNDVRLLQAEIQRRRPKSEIVVVQALLLSAVHSHQPNERPKSRTVLPVLLEAHGNRRDGSRRSAHIQSHTVLNEELLPNEVGRETAGQTEQSNIGELSHARHAVGVVVSHVLCAGVSRMRHHLRSLHPPN